MESSSAQARLKQLLARHGSRLRALVLRHCSSNQGLDPDDIEQEVHIRLWRAVERETNPALPASYIQRVVVTTVIDALRRNRPEQTLPLPEPGQEAGVEALLEQVGPVRSASDRQRMDMVQAAIQALPALFPGRRVGLVEPCYAEHHYAWRRAGFAPRALADDEVEEVLEVPVQVLEESHARALDPLVNE